MERRPLPPTPVKLRPVAEIVATDRNGRRLGDVKLAHVSDKEIGAAYDQLHAQFGSKDIYIFVDRLKAA